MKNRLVAWVATAGLTAAAGLAGTATPAFAATCYEASCNGKTLSSTSCSTTNDLINAEYSLSGVADVKLMYSSVCHAFWGVLTAPPSVTVSGDLWAIPQYGGTEVGLDAGTSSDGTYTTHLFSSAGQSVKFCWSQTPLPDPGDSPTAIAGCTSWR